MKTLCAVDFISTKDYKKIKIICFFKKHSKICFDKKNNSWCLKRLVKGEVKNDGWFYPIENDIITTTMFPMDVHYKIYWPYGKIKK